MKCIEIRAKQDTMQQRRERQLVYELIEKKALAAELEKANEEKEKEEEEREKRQRERIKDEKLRQKLRRESIELREVAAKLDVAFVNKVLDCNEEFQRNQLTFFKKGTTRPNCRA